MVEFMIPVAQPELAVLVEVEPEETTHRREKEETEPQILVEVVAAVGKHHRLTMQAAPAVQALFFSNTSPNLITKSSKHQAHGLHLLALLRSST